jgi:tRNA1Val (adenine37-N6)-methyltransferase
LQGYITGSLAFFMSNNFFNFKQFTIQQQHCAMKVCTDACLFGAWISANATISSAHSILDIGTGTGLLSLMMAQQSEALIDAVEIDEAAAQQAKLNFEASPWKERLNLIKGDIKKVAFTKKYDLVFSNPPFFANHLKSEDSQKNLALHSDALNLEELLLVVANVLADDGKFAVLLPTQQAEDFEKMAAAHALYVEEEVWVKQTVKHPWFRVFLLFCRQPCTTVHIEITIKDEHNNYPKEFVALLKDYYLFL